LDDDRLGRAEEVEFNADETYGYSQSNIKPYDSSMDHWSGLKLQEKPSDKAKPSVVKAYTPSDFSTNRGYNNDQKKVSVEVQTSEIKKLVRAEQTRVIQSAEKQVSTSTLIATTSKVEQMAGSSTASKRVQPKYEG
jgi:hypothetical protein